MTGQLKTRKGGERGNNMQHRAQVGIKPTVAAVRTGPLYMGTHSTR